MSFPRKRESILKHLPILSILLIDVEARYSIGILAAGYSVDSCFRRNDNEDR